MRMAQCASEVRGQFAGTASSPSHYVGCRDRIQVVRLGGKSPYPLSQLLGPQILKPWVMTSHRAYATQSVCHDKFGTVKGSTKT